jgi:hypothetical protein
MKALVAAVIIAAALPCIIKAQSQQSAQNGVVVGRDSINSTYYINSSVQLKLTNEQLKAIKLADADRSEEQGKLIKLLEEKLQLRENQIQAVISKLQIQNTPSDRYGEKLVEFADSYLKISEELDRISKLYPALKALRNQAQEAIDGGQLDKARQLIKEAQQKTIDVKPQAAELVALEALTAELQFDYNQAASLYQAAAILTSADQLTSLRYSLEYANLLVRNGNENNVKDLERAIQELERIKAYTEFDSLPFSNKVNAALGVALSINGVSTNNAQMLERAATILQGVINKLEIGSRDWVDAMRFLAANNVHRNRPLETVSLYEQLLADPNGAQYVSSDPTALSNLGVAYRDIAEQSHDSKMNQKSFDYFKKAYQNDAGSNDYVKGQLRYNLAIANFRMGKETNNLELLREAARLFNEALTYIHQSKDSSSWAHTQTNLGIADLEIGKVTGEVDEFGKSISAEQSALLVWQPGDIRDRWIDSTFLIAESYAELAKVEKKPEHLDKVIKTMKGAIENIDHDSQSAQLMKAYLGVAAADFDLLKIYHGESRRAESKLYYEKAARLLAERVLSDLLGIDEARPQAIAIQSKLEQLIISAPQKKPTSKKN